MKPEEIIEKFTRKASLELANKIDQHVRHCFQKQAPISYKLIYLFKWRWFARLMRFNLEQQYNPKEMRTEYRLLIWGKVIGRFATTDLEMVIL